MFVSTIRHTDRRMDLLATCHTPSSLPFLLFLFLLLLPYKKMSELIIKCKQLFFLTRYKSVIFRFLLSKNYFVSVLFSLCVIHGMLFIYSNTWCCSICYSSLEWYYHSKGYTKCIPFNIFQYIHATFIYQSSHWYIYKSNVNGGVGGRGGALCYVDRYYAQTDRQEVV